MRPRYLTTSLSVLAYLIHAVVADTSCPIQPIYFPLRNITFDSGVTTWGALVEVGNPPQRVSLSPSTVVNTTFVSQYSLCAVSDPTMTKIECESLRGGFFNENSSSTWTGVSLQDYNSTRSDPTWDHFNPPGITKVGYETIHFPADGAGGTMPSFGLALNQFGNNSNVGMLGLGKESLLLDTAVKLNVTPSRGWSMDSGSQSLDNPRAGELVLGGYNEARLDGSLTWQNVSDMSGDRPCPLRTKITDMFITLDNATEIPLKSSGEIIEACIEPYDNLFRFTPGMLLNWKQITRFEDSMLDVFNPGSLNWQNLSFTENPLPYNSSKLFDWRLTITLDSGYTTTIPQYELMAPLRGWDALGERTVIPGISEVGILDTPTGEGEVPTLGKIFLSQSYLAVNYDQHQFGLAKLATGQPLAPALVPFSCEQATKPKLSPASPGSADQKNVAPIIGGAVGGAICFLAIIAVVFFVMKRRKQDRTAQIAAAPNMAYQWQQHPPIEPWGLTGGVFHVNGSPQPVHEMSVDGARGKCDANTEAVEIGTRNSDERAEKRTDNQAVR